MKRIIFFAAILAAASSLFAQKMSRRVRSVPPQLTEAVSKKPKENLQPLVSCLLDGVTDEEEKVKILHDWVCDTISFDTAMYFSGLSKKQDAMSVLKKNTALSEGYARVMNELCTRAGLESIVINGYSKGFGYLGALMTKTDHTWNAVKVNGAWKLLDVTWDAGRVDFKTWIKSYSSDWLSLTPEQFIYSHLPENDEHQFLGEKERRTREMFVKEPYIPASFFASGLALSGNIPDYATGISSPLTIQVALTKPNVIIMAEIESKTSGAYIPGATWITRTADSATVSYDVPDTEPYKAMLFAKSTDGDAFTAVFSADDFEGSVIPEISALLSEKKITKKEYDFFRASYRKVGENARYYLVDDFFDDERTEALKKVFSLLDTDGTDFEPIFAFDVKAKPPYGGFGRGNAKYPESHLSYSSARSTHPVAPLQGSLKKGSTVKFVVESGEYSKFAVKLTDSLVQMTKNPATGLFELEATVPDTKTVTVFASNGSNSYFGLWSYAVRD